MLSNSESPHNWSPMVSGHKSISEQMFGYYQSFSHSWISDWSNGKSELRIFGSGNTPSEEQKRIWATILPQLDQIVELAIASLPPKPNRQRLFGFLKPKDDVKIDLTKRIDLELFDDGSYELLIMTDLVVDAGEVGGFVKFDGDCVVEAGWSV